jgi:serine beta-lactamase-like protein LACTB, mitochondrial
MSNCFGVCGVKSQVPLCLPITSENHMTRSQLFRRFACISLTSLLGLACARPLGTQAIAIAHAAQPDAAAAIDSGRAILLTKFRIGSVSKSLTSTALGLLYESGKIDLDAPVQKYVPSFPVKAYPITTREIAGHLAGLRHYGPGEFLSSRHYDNVLESLSIFSNDTLLFRPGDKYSYSTYGFVLVSAVVEGASGESFLPFMQRHVFDPLGLRHTTPEYLDSIIPDRARFYTRNDSTSPIINAPYVDNSNKWAGGGFLSTTEDLALFGDEMITAKILKPSTVDLLWTSQKTTAGKATGYGLGWFVSTDSAGRQIVRHGGGSDGGTAMLILYPKQRVVFAFLFNSDTRQPPLQRVINLFIGNN